MSAGGNRVRCLAPLRVVEPPPPDSESVPVESRRQRIERYAGYSLHGIIARGGMATVWHATAPDGTEVALKRMLPVLAANPQTVLMFSDEALLGMRLRHPRLIHTLALDVFDGEPFLVMEYVAGPSVSDLLNRSTTPLGPAAAVHIVEQLLDGLSAVHEPCDDDGAALGVVHRDVSPNNILLTPDGDAMLGDFGIARITRGAPAPSPKALQGKVGYMAPEQLAGRPVDARADLFAAGVVLLELLSGRRAFARDHKLRDTRRQLRRVRAGHRRRRAGRPGSRASKGLGTAPRGALSVGSRLRPSAGARASKDSACRQVGCSWRSCCATTKNRSNRGFVRPCARSREREVDLLRSERHCPRAPASSPDSPPGSRGLPGRWPLARRSRPTQPCRRASNAGADCQAIDSVSRPRCPSAPRSHRRRPATCCGGSRTVERRVC